MLNSEVSSILLSLLHGSLEAGSRISHSQLGHARELVSILEVRLLGTTISILIVHFGVNTSLRLVLNPFSNEEFVLGVVKVRTLALTLVADPVAFEMISVSLGKNTVTIALALMPLTFINVLVGVDHTTFTLRKSINPVAVVPVSVLIEEGASAVLLVLVPVTCVLSSELGSLVFPVSTLTVALINGPHTFVLVAILVELDAEALFAVISPVSDILLTGLPLLALDGTILLLRFL